ncbi:MAG: VWA domain-containing protein [Bryobacterales bacterium]|nr:VWA domain-containing protein [Bryobacterales bacterium]
MKRVLAAFLLLWLPVRAWPQDNTFAVLSRLVVVPVAVTDAKGKFIDGLTAADFTLLDNGRLRDIQVDSWETGAAPISLVIAVQASGISAAALEKIRKVGAMIQPLITGERGCAAVVAFASQVSWLQECTSDAARIARAIESIQPGEPKAARLLDAVEQGIARLKRRANSRRVLLLISESRDRGSETALDIAMAAAQSASVTVYGATYSAFKTAWTARPSGDAPTPLPRGRRLPPSEENRPAILTPGQIPPPEQRADIAGGLGELKRLGEPETVKLLVEATGGAKFPFTRQRALEEAIEKLGAELHSQYVLSFAPDAAAPPGFRRLEVRVKAKAYRVRARPGYWAIAP